MKLLVDNRNSAERRQTIPSCKKQRAGNQRQNLTLLMLLLPNISITHSGKLTCNCIFDLNMTREKSSCSEYFVTLVSGLICIIFLILIASYYSPNDQLNLQNTYNETDALSAQSRSEGMTVTSELPKTDGVSVEKECNSQNSGNPSFEHAIKDAKNFEKSHATKDTFLKRVHHRLTHREEASRAAFILTGMAILLFVALVATKMWKDKEHHAISLKQVVSYPQDDRKVEILVKGMHLIK